MSEYEDLLREHVLRPTLPWREEDVTECGRNPSHGVISREAFFAKVRKQGKTRAMLTTCVTCFQAAERWPDWNVNPVAVVAREVSKFAYWERQEKTSFHDELRAIALLVDAHREEFEETLAALREAIPFQRKTPRGRGIA